MVSKFLTRAAARAKLASAVAVATAKMHEIFMPLVVLADARWLQCKSHMHVCHKEVPSGLQTASRDRFNSRRKEGRKITHHSSRLGLIGWTGSIQIIKTIHHKMCNTNNVQLPHELLHGHNVCTKQSRISVPNRLQGRALKDKGI